MTAPYTWPRELPVLQAAVAAMDDGTGLAMLGDLEAATGMPFEDVRRAVIALHRGGVIVAGPMTESAAGTQVHFVNDLTREAYELAGAWPTPENLATRIVEALEQIAEDTNDEDERTRLQKLVAGLKTGGRQAIISAVGIALGGTVT